MWHKIANLCTVTFNSIVFFWTWYDMFVEHFRNKQRYTTAKQTLQSFDCFNTIEKVEILDNNVPHKQ